MRISTSSVRQRSPASQTFTKPGPATSARVTPALPASASASPVGDLARRPAQPFREQHRGVGREVPVLRLARNLEAELRRRALVTRRAQQLLRGRGDRLVQSLSQ